MSATYDTVGEVLAPVLEALDRHAMLVEALTHPAWKQFESACLDWSYNHLAVFRHPDGITFFMTQVYKLVSTSASATRSVKEGISYMQGVQQELGATGGNTVRNRALLYARWIESQLPEVMGALGIFALRGLRERLAEVPPDSSEQARSWLVARAHATILDTSWHSRWATEMVLHVTQRNRPDILEALRILTEQVARRIHRFEAVTFQTQQARSLRELLVSRAPEEREAFLSTPAETVPELEALVRVPALLEKEEKIAGECLQHLEHFTGFARDRDVLTLATDLYPSLANLVHQRLSDRRPLVEQLRKTITRIQARQTDLSPLGAVPGEASTDRSPQRNGPAGCAMSASSAAVLAWLVWMATHHGPKLLLALGGS